jgi:hypothetical protein
LRARFKNTKFGAFLPIVPVAAAPNEAAPYGIEKLLNTILMNMEIPNRDTQKQHFKFAIDHCF